MHNRPSISQTLLLPNIYVKPIAPDGDDGTYASAEDDRKVQDHFDDFFEDMFEEFTKHGELEILNVCENTADHMAGNVYAKVLVKLVVSTQTHTHARARARPPIPGHCRATMPMP